MTESLQFRFNPGGDVQRRSHVGVVASGDLEVLLQPVSDDCIVTVQTNAPGFRATWEALLQRFFLRHPVAVAIEIHDHGATPGMVWLRLEQAMELAQRMQETE